MSCSVSIAMAPQTPRASMEMLERLAEHGGSDERHSLVRHVEALAILFGIDPRVKSWRDARALVDDHAGEDRAAPDLDLRKEDRLVDLAIAVHPHAREEEGVADRGTAHDAAARDHGVDRRAAPSLEVEDEFRGRTLLVESPDRP